MIKLSMLSEPTVDRLAKVFRTKAIPVVISDEEFMSLPKIVKIMIVGDVKGIDFSSKKYPRHVRLRYSACNHCPKETQHDFLNEKDIQFVLNVAGNPATSTDDLECLSRHNNPRVRAKVAYNPTTPDTTLRRLAMNSNLYVRQAVTSNKHVPEDILFYIARDRSALVRQGIACQFNLSYNVSQILLHDSNTSVLFALARNKTLEKAEQVLMELARTGITVVQKAVAHNPYATQAILNYLWENGDDEVRESVTEVRSA